MTRPAGALAVLAVLAACAFAAGPAAASHVQCGDTITTDTTLDSNVAGCRGNGIVIGADGITLDLNEFIVDRDGLGPTGAGVLNQGFDDLTVRNGTIKQFPFGVQLEGVTGNEIRSVQVSGNVTGVTLTDATGNVVEANSIFSSFAHPGDALVLGEGASGNRIARNTLSGINGIHSLALTGEAGPEPNLLLHNKATSSTVDGILLEAGAQQALVEGNKAQSNQDDGIDARAAAPSPHLVGANSANVNGDLGIDAVPEVTDRGGNQAYGNGNADQCVNVNCDKTNATMFGKPIAGTSFAPLQGGEKQASPFFVVVPVTLRKLTVFVDGGGAGSGSQLIRGVIYTHAGPGPGNRLSRSFQATIPAGSPGRWVNLYLPFALRVPAGVFWLGIHSGQDSGVARFAWEPVEGSRFFNADAYPDGPDNPFGPASSDDRQLSIYASGSYSPP